MRLRWVLCALWCMIAPVSVFAQFDTLESPIVKDGLAALDSGDVMRVLKWVKPEGEVEVCETFNKALAVRSKGPEAKELADKYFCNTLVRLYHTGEGESFSGITASSKNPVVSAAYQAMGSGSADELSKLLNDKVNKGLNIRLSNVVEKKKTSEESMDAGKAYVVAYTEFMKYVSGLDGIASAKP
jgi:hypothetical protein